MGKKQPVLEVEAEVVSWYRGAHAGWGGWAGTPCDTAVQVQIFRSFRMLWRQPKLQQLTQCHMVFRRRPWTVVRCTL